MAPGLADLFGVLLPVGALVGAIIGFSLRARDDRVLVKHVVDGAQVGAVCGTAVALAIWAGSKLAAA